MHPNPLFRQTVKARNIDFVRTRAFGTLIVNGDELPLTASIPAVLSEDGDRLEFHLVRSNPLARVLEQDTRAVFLVNGPDSYVSPDWYEVDDQVPTWNYVTVRIEGTARCLPQEDLRPVLDRLSAHMENMLLPKPAWTTDKMTPDVLARMMRAIVPCEMQVSRIDATWKLSQNKPDAVLARAARAIDASGIGHEVQALADLMKSSD